MSSAAAEAEAVADRLWSLGATAIAEDGGDLVAGFAEEATVRAAADALSRSGALCHVSADDGSWRSVWRAFAGDVVVGPLRIRIVDRRAADGVGAAATPSPAGDNLPDLEIDPADSFGIGHHTSTRQCLQEIVGRAGAGVSVLDVGCGSGVLAVAAAALGAGPVVALDVDPAAAAVAAANARANGVDIQVVCGELAAVRGAFDLVVANLGGAEAPIAMAAALAGAVRPGGDLFLGGMLAEQADVVRRAYARWGLGSVTMDEGWAGVTIAKKD